MPLKKVEVFGTNQKILENQCLRNIRQINAKLKKFYATYNDYDNADERLRARYTKEQYKEIFIDYQIEERRRYIYKLRDIRKGYIYE